MKKVVLSGLLMMNVVGWLLATDVVSYQSGGYGQNDKTARTNVVITTGFVVDELHICNTETNGGQTIFALVNVSTNTFTNRLAQGTCLPIPGGKSYRFTVKGQTITSYALATSTNTAGYFVGGM